MADLFAFDPDRAWNWGAIIAGAFVPLSFQTGLTKREIIAQPLVAIASARFLTPGVCEHFGMTSPEMLITVGFVISMLSYKVLQWILTGDTLGKFLSKKIGG
jgi:hypothetical protein